jgi:glycosyltransferase involved in cell wall biosynthesis
MPQPPLQRLCYVCEATEGGVRKHLRDLLRVFLRAEENFEILGIFGDRGEKGFADEVAALAAQHPNFRYAIVPELRRPINPLRDWPAYARIRGLLREFRPDIVHTHSAKGGFLGRKASRALGIRRVIHTPHVFPFQMSGGLRGRVYLALERHAARLCSALVCVGPSQRACALERRLCAPEKLVVIRNALDSAPPPTGSRTEARRRLKLGETGLVVGMVARLAPQKGVGRFVRAAALVLKQLPESTFVLVGGGPLEAELRARAATLGVPPERFRIEGHREDAHELYPAFDVLALSSLYEGLPYVLLEAMARGVPVVATDVPGTNDVVVDEETGLLARVNDESHIARQIVRILADPALRTRLCAASLERVRTVFSFEDFIRGHRALYRPEE